MRARIRTLLPTFLFVIVGCDGAVDQGAVTRTDSAGVEIVESRRAVADLPAWQIGSTPRLEVGDEATPLFRVAGVVRLSHGGLAIGNGGSGEILWFTAEGLPDGVSGGEGEGPGEYRWLERLVGLPGDSIVAVAGLASTVNLYGPDRDLVRSWQIEPLGRFNQPSPVGRHGDAFYTTTQRSDDSSLGHMSYDGFLVRYQDGAVVDTTLTFEGGEGFTVRCGPNDRAVCNIGVIYGKTHSVAVGNPGVAISGTGSELLVFEQGSLRRILRVSDPPVPVTEQLAAAYIDSLISLFPSDRAVEQREMREQAPAGTVLPRIVALLWDEAGMLWANRGDRPGNQWDVFSDAGERVATAQLPSGSKLWQVGVDFVVVTEKDEFDREFVRVYDLGRTGR